MTSPAVTAPTTPDDRGGRIFTRPRWFRTLFLTDVWERFSFYGMQAILVLYAAAPVEDGGLGLPRATAASLFGVYMAAVFLLALPGGWLGDRVLGLQRAVLYGAGIIAAGHYCLAVPSRACSYLGMVLIAVGTGLLKPNIGALLSRFYGPGRTAEREAAISIFYMSVQVSALLAPLITGLLAETVGWHAGFGAAGIGMTAGLLQYVVGRRSFGAVGAAPERPADRATLRRVGRRTGYVLAVVVVLLAVDVLAGAFTAQHVIAGIGLSTFILPFVAYTALRRSPAVSLPARRRLSTLLRIFLAASLFWMLVGQSGSLLSLFAKSDTDRDIAGFIVPAGWFQSATPLFLLLMAPGFAWLWLRSGSRYTVPAKFAAGLLLAGVSFLIMAAASGLAADGPVSPLWLLAVFAVQAAGELALAPVGISVAVEAAPERFVAQTVGLWWMFCAFGVGVGSQVVHLVDVLGDPGYYLMLGTVAVLVAGLLAGGVRRLAAGLSAS